MKYLLSCLLIFSSFHFTPAYGAEKQQTYQITLYYSPQCPHCQKVLSYMRQAGIKVPMKNVKADRKAKDELKEIGGYLVVPCLIVNGMAIYDANDIIDWLSAHQEDLSKSKS